MSELKSCPFCEREAILDGITAICRHCGAYIYRGTWDCRPVEDAQAVEIDRLKKELEAERAKQGG